MEGKKLTQKSWPLHEYFIPYFYDFKGTIHGISDDQLHTFYYLNVSDAWEFYTEPKKKVNTKRYRIRSCQDIIGYSAGVEVDNVIELEEVEE